MEFSAIFFCETHFFPIGSLAEFFIPIAPLFQLSLKLLIACGQKSFIIFNEYYFSNIAWEMAIMIAHHRSPKISNTRCLD
jgi:hypothetical protein